jgi:hypothetical protein
MPNKTETVEIQELAKNINLMYLFHREEFNILIRERPYMFLLRHHLIYHVRKDVLNWKLSSVIAQFLSSSKESVCVTLLLLKVLSSCLFNEFLPSESSGEVQ